MRRKERPINWHVDGHVFDLLRGLAPARMNVDLIDLVQRILASMHRPGDMHCPAIDNAQEIGVVGAQGGCLSEFEV